MALSRTLRSSLAAATLVATVAVPFAAHAKLTKAGKGEAGFHAKGPAGLSIDGTTSDVGVVDDGKTVKVVVNLADIKTGMELRDGHTKADLEVAKFPAATIAVDRGALKFPSDGKVSADVPAKLTIHGETRDVTFHYDAKKDGDAISVDGSVKIRVGDFGVKPRSYLGISIKPEVEIFAKLTVKDG